MEKSYQLAQTFVHELKDEEAEDLIVSIGPIVERLSEIPQAYRYTQNMLQTYGVLRTERIISYEDDIKDGEVSPTNPFKLDLAQKIAQTEADELEELVLELQGTPGDTEERNRLFRFFVLTELGNLVQKKKPGSEQPLLEKMNDLDQLAAVAADAAEYTQIIEKLLAFLMAAHINPFHGEVSERHPKSLGIHQGEFYRSGYLPECRGRCRKLESVAFQHDLLAIIGADLHRLPDRMPPAACEGVVDRDG